MNEENRIVCPFCAELILPDALKCRFCGEWLNKKDEEEVVRDPPVDDDLVVDSEVFDSKTSDKKRGSSFSRFKILLVVFYISLVIVAVIYEANAGEVLGYAREKVREGKQEVAYLAYQTVVRKYSLSFADSEAIAEVSNINEYSFGFDLPEFEPTFFERLSEGRFNPCFHYGLPLVASVIGIAVCLLMIVVRASRLKCSAFSFFLFALSALIFMVQVTAYGWVDVSSPSFVNMSINIMRSYELVYIVSYVLLVMTAIETLRGTKK